MVSLPGKECSAHTTELQQSLSRPVGTGKVPLLKVSRSKAIIKRYKKFTKYSRLNISKT